ncbi:MAG: PDDEXK nuclease domain-containing protein [Gemmataceae bacterium]|nr:PDDEXK nuclease domain-containing protein [Gemmataceae bacterium]
MARERKPVPSGELADPPAGYAELLVALKDQIGAAQVRAAVAVNRELIELYWRIGREIVERQEREGWGKGVIERLAKDLQSAFPGLQGFSPTNVWRMRAFFQAYATAEANLARAMPDLQAVGPPAFVTGLPWGHNISLVQKVKDPTAREWYGHQAITNGWSRPVLVHQIDTDLYARQGKALTNFDRTLPAPQSDLARQLLKDPYNLGFLSLAADAHERDLERALLDRLRDFLVELGVGFAFVGSQYHLAVGGQDFYLDLLFYHLKLRCFVVIDLKVEEFKPEFAGKMNFYLSAADDLLRHPADQPSIGLILCRERNRVIVEYSLRDTSKPMGVAGYELRRDALPAGLRESLPSVAQIEAELRKVEAADEGDTVEE